MLATVAVPELAGGKKMETEKSSCFNSFVEPARRPADKQCSFCLKRHLSLLYCCILIRFCGYSSDKIMMLEVQSYSKKVSLRQYFT